MHRTAQGRRGFFRKDWHSTRFAVSAQQVAARLTKIGSEISEEDGPAAVRIGRAPEKSGGEPLPNIEGAQSTITCKPSEGVMISTAARDNLWTKSPQAIQSLFVAVGNIISVRDGDEEAPKSFEFAC